MQGQPILFPMLRTLALALLATSFTAFGATPLPLSSAQLKKMRSVTAESTEPGVVRFKLDDPSWDAGLRLLPPDGAKFWDLSAGKVLAVDVENLSPNKQLRLTIHIASGTKETKDESEIYGGIALNPGEKRAMTLLIPHKRIYGLPIGVAGPKVVDSEKIHSIDLKMLWPFEVTQAGLVDCKLSNLRLEGTPDNAAIVPADKFFPFVDIYGQYTHADWPEKIHTDEDLKKERAKEDTELAASPRPQEWNRFGGWANGPKLEATGNFRTAKHDGKWWLVDPEGRLFFSQGIDVLRSHTDSTKATDTNKNWFAFPVNSKYLPFNDWNLEKKYGKTDYDADYYATLSKRLDHWGMNTIGNWGKSDLMALGHTPYTVQLTDYNGWLPKIAGSDLKFYDVFDPRYVEAMKNLVATAQKRSPEVTKSLTDPMCIGYFIDNELNYGNRGRQVLGDHVLRSPATQASKKEFVNDLKAQYSEIGKLNAAWETNYTDWDALLTKTDVPTSKGFRTDSGNFFRKTVDQYFRLCRDAIKSVAPHRLYLGSRFIATDAVRKPLYDASFKYCDVLTLNVYSHSVANLGSDDFPDMPVMLGEFHLGVRDRGMFSPSSVPVGVTQAERALAYTRFLQGALVHPNIVGTHWFQFRDQPLTGRWDGEGYCIGFVDVADTPYPELIRATREIGETMYGYRTRGKLAVEMK